MRRYLKTLASWFLIPLTRLYLKKERTFTFRDTRVVVFPGVFHPGLFSSTKLLLEHLNDSSLHGKTLLELGSGTGLISVIAAKAGAEVTATDIQPKAVENTTYNAATNAVNIRVKQSDLFDALTKTSFDYIVINPPYYAKAALTDEERAWNCGENFEYFHKLFARLGEYLHSDSKVIMVLTKGCDLTSIFAIARRNGFDFRLLKEKNVLFDEKDYLFQLIPVTTYHPIRS